MTQAQLNPFSGSDDNKRYLTYSHYLKKRFGTKVYKVPLDTDMGCPNRDGSKGVGGCAFCSAKRSGDFAGDPGQSILSQYEHMRTVMEKKWQGGKCIPYFQAGSNTYTDIRTLAHMLDTAMSLPDAAGVSIATRADCLDEEKCSLLGEYSKNTYLVCELGLQTVNDNTARLMNRCHSFYDFLKGYEMLRKHGVNVWVHLINGLPGETHDDMLTSARVISSLELHMVKLHLLHILKGTPLEKMYLSGSFAAMELYDYVNIIADQIECFDKNVIIGRVTGDGARADLIAPLWSLDKKRVMNEIDKELFRRKSYQGVRYVCKQG